MSVQGWKWRAETDDSGLIPLGLISTIYTETTSR